MTEREPFRLVEENVPNDAVVVIDSEGGCSQLGSGGGTDVRPPPAGVWAREMAELILPPALHDKYNRAVARSLTTAGETDRRRGSRRSRCGPTAPSSPPSWWSPGFPRTG